MRLFGLLCLDISRSVISLIAYVSDLLIPLSQSFVIVDVTKDFPPSLVFMALDSHTVICLMFEIM